MRLAVMVGTIDSEAAMAPEGALCMTPTGAIAASPAFAGSTKETACSASGYVFVNQKKPVDALATTATKAADCLVSCETLVPKGALCTSVDEANGCVLVRNLVWPGFVAYTWLGAPFWGYAYFGSGQKNADIAFMLH